LLAAVWANNPDDILPVARDNLRLDAKLLIVAAIDP
jgi:hypothetical protein